MQCAAVCCSVLQRVAVCYSVLQYNAVCCSAVQCIAVNCSVLQCVAVRCSVMQCVTVCCSILQCAAVCCSVLQFVAACCSVLQRVAVCCSVLLNLAQLQFVVHLKEATVILKGGPEPLQKKINKILCSKREDRLSDPFCDLVQNTTLVRFSYLLRLCNFCKAPRDMRKFPQKRQKTAEC